MAEFEVRDARPSDRQRLANLIHFEEYVHRHLDWKPALDWIGSPPYLVVERSGELVAALACPTDPPGAAWIRLFAATSRVSLDQMWQLLWEQAFNQVLGKGRLSIFALSLHAWFTELLKRNSIEHVQDVVVLTWESTNSWQLQTHSQVQLRPMSYDDLSAVCELDGLAFDMEWRNSRDALEMAYSQASIASVAVIENEILGYQISTASTMGGHLARLAVHPTLQGRGVGTSLVQNLLESFQLRGIHRVTVNTQADNHSSLAIYQKVGFQLTDERYPVFRLAVLR